jgi:hypothetical protein
MDAYTPDKLTAEQIGQMFEQSKELGEAQELAAWVQFVSARGAREAAESEIRRLQEEARKKQAPPEPDAP